MKIENAEVTLQSQLKSTKKHSSSIVEFELRQNEKQLRENAYKANVATKLLLSTDFSSQDRCKKQIIENTIGTVFHKKDFFIDVENENSALIIKTKEEYYQKQTVDFSTSLDIQTPNKNYTMDLEIAFSEELYKLTQGEVILGNAELIDPLVINYDDDINPFDNLSKLRFEFDLDSDGTTEMIPLLKKGAGFLAYDKNQNKKIDNGSELFGPKTAQGFEELAQYDRDHNNWIDENDPIYNALKVWQINEDGDNELVSLIDLNVGAIYLGNVASGFEYKDGVEKINAMQRSNGVYVKDDGSGVRMISALDLSSI